MLLAPGLRNKDDDPAGMAATTLMLIFVRNMLRALHKLPPSATSSSRTILWSSWPALGTAEDAESPAPRGERGQGSLPAVSGYALAHLIRRYIARFPC